MANLMQKSCLTCFKLNCHALTMFFLISMFPLLGKRIMNNDEKKMKSLVQLFKLKQVLQNASDFSVLVLILR